MITGAVVQAGSIDHVSLASSPTPEQLLVPRQLPLAIRGFTGRLEHIAALDALLPADANAATTGAVVISALDGTAGVGKTTLAVHWAHRVQHHFPDGTLFANLHGYGPGEPATPGDVLDNFLRALGTPPQQIPIGPDAQAALYRSLLAERRVLIVLDNANHPDQVRPLLPAAPGCVVLITSRASLTGLVINEAATRITLDLLGPQEAVDLIREIVGRERADAEPEAVTTLTQVCARLPLALRIAAGRATARPHLAIADVLAEVADDPRRLEALSNSIDHTTAVRAVFDWSYRRLTSEQALLFRRLGLHPGPEISTHAAAAVADLPITLTRRLMEEIADAHMIEPVERDRYRFHDLLRAYAAERANQEDTTNERDRAHQRLLSWYTFHTAEADRLLTTAVKRSLFDSAKAVGPLLTFADREHALGWLDAEHTNLVAAARSAIRSDQLDLAMRLIEALGRFLSYRGHWHDRLGCAALAVTAAQRSHSRNAEALFLTTYAEAIITAYQWDETSQWDEALDYARRGLNMARDLSNRHLEAVARNSVGLCFLERDRYAEALDHLEPALPVIRDAGDIRMIGVIEGNLSRAHAGMGNYHRARDHAERGLAMRRQAGDLHGECFALRLLASAYQGLGLHADAINYCEDAVIVGREHGSPPETAVALEILGISYQCTGDTTRAETCWTEALEILVKFGDYRATNLRDRLNSPKAMIPDESEIDY